ncbi:hypothetical protein SNK03_013059 [Fusarium graminearum]
MECAGWTAEQRLFFDLSYHRNALDRDILPSLNNFDTTGKWHYPTWYRDDDGQVAFTPRGLIVATAENCVSKRKCHPEFFPQVLACPHEDMHEFIACLKCRDVTAAHINEFELFIRGRQFGYTIYDTSEFGFSMNWDKRSVYCPLDLNLEHDSKDNFKIRARADGAANESYDYTYTGTIKYPISDGPTPEVTIPASDSTQTPNSDDSNEDETGSVSTDVAAGTKTVKNKEAAPTTSSPSKNVAGRNVISKVNVYVVLSVVVSLRFV